VLSPNERLGLEALHVRESKEYLIAKEKRPAQGSAWARGPAPLHLKEEVIVNSAVGGGPLGGGSAGAPVSKRLVGRIAVGVIMISGPQSLALTTDQQVKIAAEVQNGLSWLGAQSPAKDVTWVHDNHLVTVSVPSPTSTPIGDPYEFYERPWRDAALVQLGYAAGPAGVNAYITALKASRRADAAYCAFFSHYPLQHFAYCTGPYVVMQFENDGWGPDNLDRVFAHETGHVFGAPDEYKEAGRNCGGSHGFFGKPNLNCESCAENGGVDCIMRNNAWAMCSVTPYHLGYSNLPAGATPALAPHVA
jgi:hypothetical protein